MPKAKLPTTLKGWILALIASMVGFVSGFFALSLLTRWFK